MTEIRKLTAFFRQIEWHKNIIALKKWKKNLGCNGTSNRCCSRYYKMMHVRRNETLADLDRFDILSVCVYVWWQANSTSYRAYITDECTLNGCDDDDDDDAILMRRRFCTNTRATKWKTKAENRDRTHRIEKIMCNHSNFLSITTYT